MKNRNRNSYMLVVGMIVSLLVIVSCGGQFPATPKGTYAQSLSMFNDIVESYYSVLKAQDEATKQQWKEDINPSIHAAGSALDMWGAAVGTTLEENKHMLYLRMWQSLLPMLLEVGVLKIEE